MVVADVGHCGRRRCFLLSLIEINHRILSFNIVIAVIVMIAVEVNDRILTLSWLACCSIYVQVVAGWSVLAFCDLFVSM